MAGSHACIPGAICTQLVGAMLSKRDPVLQIFNSCALISASDYIGVDRAGGYCCTSLPTLLQVPPLQMTSRAFKGPTSFFPLNFSLFPFGEPDTKG